MGTLNTSEILRFAAPNGSNNVPLGFIPVDASRLTLPASSGTARIEYRAWYNAQTKELIIGGKALPQPIGGNGMGISSINYRLGTFDRQINGQTGDYYESHSTPRKLHAGCTPKTLSKLAGNDDCWGIAA